MVSLCLLCEDLRGACRRRIALYCALLLVLRALGRLLGASGLRLRVEGLARALAGLPGPARRERRRGGAAGRSLFGSLWSETTLRPRLPAARLGALGDLHVLSAVPGPARAPPAGASVRRSRDGAELARAEPARAAIVALAVLGLLGAVLVVAVAGGSRPALAPEPARDRAPEPRALHHAVREAWPGVRPLRRAVGDHAAAAPAARTRASRPASRAGAPSLAAGLLAWSLAVGASGFRDDEAFRCPGGCPRWRDELAHWCRDPSYAPQVWPVRLPLDGPQWRVQLAAVANLARMSGDPKGPARGGEVTRERGVAEKTRPEDRAPAALQGGPVQRRLHAHGLRGRSARDRVPEEPGRVERADAADPPLGLGHRRRLSARDRGDQGRRPCIAWPRSGATRCAPVWSPNERDEPRAADDDPGLAARGHVAAARLPHGRAPALRARARRRGRRGAAQRRRGRRAADRASSRRWLEREVEKLPEGKGRRDGADARVPPRARERAPARRQRREGGGRGGRPARRDPPGARLARGDAAARAGGHAPRRAALRLARRVEAPAEGGRRQGARGLGRGRGGGRGRGARPTRCRPSPRTSPSWRRQGSSTR